MRNIYLLLYVEQDFLGGTSRNVRVDGIVLYVLFLHEISRASAFAAKRKKYVCDRYRDR
jgi:hypothetical protein